jgi:hypothetical protein
MKLYREHTKSKSHTAKLTEMLVPILSFNEFLEALGVKPSLSFRLFSLRVVGVAKFEEEGSLAAAAESLIEGGLVKALGAVTAPAPAEHSSGSQAQTIDVALWLSGLFFDLFARAANEASEKAVDVRTNEVCKELQRSYNLFEKALPQQQCGEFLFNLNTLKVLFEAAAQELVSSAAALQEAVHRWNSVVLARSEL